mgnify:CR=1 FL=1
MAANKEDEAGVAEQPKRSKLKKLFMMLIVASILGSGAYAGWVFFFQEKQQASGAEPGDKVIEEMETFLVNLADPGGKRYLKITMQLVLSNNLAGREFNERASELRDNVLLLLSSKRYEDIATFAGKIALKQETITQLNRKLSNGQVEDIYFTEFLVQ